MALKDPRHKVQSSLASFLFVNKDLPFLENYLPWDHISRTFALIDVPTGKTKEDYSILIMGTRIAMCGYHLEIMQEALSEFMENYASYQSVHDALYELQKYLYLLRCALLHADGELLPVWEFNRKKPSPKEQNVVDKLEKKGLTIKIPCIKSVKNGTKYLGFDVKEKSKYYHRLNCKIRLKHKVGLGKRLIRKLILLSYHVLAITKKKNINTLSKYLNRTIVKQK